ncbi:S41 family peptidase [Corynebacterium halotolerans]|uniref:Nisin-resistance protein n=1 Tax=Corynebacterium halotolerans YIM 70093 = DSM 44683 TaxID=1121362 RepID=M1N0S2_9CORY|nr:S41 family peptidase [Corynebacterium halotolerans]AGF73499.1 nisin-resistance protein [Corynebacterium halotolerans YIM 70093 = DSM 44683]
MRASSDEFIRARAEAEEAAGQADGISEIHDELDAALTAAGGKHSGLVTPGQMEEALAQPVAQPTVTVDGGVATATVPAHFVEHDGQAYADRLGHGIHDAVAHEACGVIVDLRGNSGGDMGPMLAGLSGLISDGTALTFIDRYNERPVLVEGNATRGGGSAVSVDGAGKYDVPVAVLADAGTGSSGEMTMLAFRGLHYSRSFGEPTAGYATANTTFNMPDGAQVMLTTAEVRDRTGVTFNDTPVVPDEVTGAEQAADAAAGWLAYEYGCR